MQTWSSLSFTPSNGSQKETKTPKPQLCVSGDEQGLPLATLELRTQHFWNPATCYLWLLFTIVNWNFKNTLIKNAFGNNVTCSFDVSVLIVDKVLGCDTVQYDIKSYEIQDKILQFWPSG